MPLNVKKQPLYEPEAHPYPKWVRPPAVDGKPSEPLLANNEADEARILDGKPVPQPEPDSTAPAVFNAPAPPYVFQEYPKWVDGRIIERPEDEEAPPAAPNLALVEAAQSDERAMLLRMAEEHGIKADGRWGLAKLRDIVMAAVAEAEAPADVDASA